MSILKKVSTTPGGTDTSEENQVASYLKGQPDFFERHSDLLAHLKLPHNTGGAAVSLVERQTAIMRTRNEKLEKRLRELVAVARTNQELSDKTHSLTVKLMGAQSIQQTLSVIEASLREDFGSERTAMVLFMAADASPGLVSNNFMRRIPATDEALKAFRTFLEESKPRCGQIRDTQKEFLFGPDTMDVGSAALLPIRTQRDLGMLAIGNQDTHHFHPAMSTDFLVRLSQSITTALQRFNSQFI